MIHLFIDTNILLDFFAFSTDDLGELAKLHAAINADGITLYSTDQLGRELGRRREEVISESLSEIQDRKASTKLPQIARNLNEHAELLQFRAQYENSLNAIRQRVIEQYESKSLQADISLNAVLSVATHIEESEEILARARARVETGTPPGKKGSIGDAINWESLLEGVPEGDIYLVSADADFSSPIAKDRMADFLATEWNSKKNGQATLYRRIGAFFADQYPDITVAAEAEQEIRVNQLAHSGSFYTTHQAIERLSTFPSLTVSQAGRLIEAIHENPQIYRIREDPDVAAFYTEHVAPFLEELPPENSEMFNSLFGGDFGWS